ncbi:hypothetical protein ACIP2X_18915 [Streptomyces sp. NPDC089424]|uniref:hypothetical protein n=1 Tax=Streptomyces sp. NPDC089424 TaxID=3365917 RepID=UPI003825D9CD
MQHQVTARTLDLFTGRNGAALNFSEVTVMLVAMTSAQVTTWKWVGDDMDGTDPVQGWELRDSSGSLLGVILPLGHMASAIHAEWYDPQADEFFPAGETGAPVLTQAISLVVNARRYAVGELPAGRDCVLDPARPAPRRNQACPWGYCWDEDCVDHGPVRAAAA